MLGMVTAGTVHDPLHPAVRFGQLGEPVVPTHFVQPEQVVAQLRVGCHDPMTRQKEATERIVGHILVRLSHKVFMKTRRTSLRVTALLHQQYQRLGFQANGKLLSVGQVSPSVG
jgi:hypothetical protein